MVNLNGWKNTAPKRIEALLALSHIPQTCSDLEAKGISSGDVNYYVGRVDPDKRATADSKAKRGVDGYKYVSFIGEGLADIDNSKKPASFWLTPKGIELQRAVGQ